MEYESDQKTNNVGYEINNSTKNLLNNLKIGLRRSLGKGFDKVGSSMIKGLNSAASLSIKTTKLAGLKMVAPIIIGVFVLIVGVNILQVNSNISGLVPRLEKPEYIVSPGPSDGEGGGNPNYNWGKYVENMDWINVYAKRNEEALCKADMTKYQIELEAKIDQGGGKRTRYGVASAAQYLAFDFPFWVPYYWGGGHGDIDLNGGFLEKGEFYTTKWGCERFQGHEGAGKAYNTWRKNGLDCSGFVTWAYNSAGFRDWSGSDEYRWKKGLFNRIGFGSSNCEKIKSLVQPGDVLKRDTPSSHTAIVLASDDNRIKYAQEGGSGKGLNIGFIDICTGKGSTSFQFFISMDNYFNTLGTK